MTDDELKAAFAALLLEHTDPFKAALAQFPNDKFPVQKALRVATEWPKDPIVLTALRKLKSSGAELDSLPSEATFAKQIWEVAQAAIEDKDKIAALKLYGEARGYIKKADTNVGVTVNNNKVMVVRDMGTNDEWEAKAELQQRELINVAASRH